MTETMNKFECLNENELMFIDGGRWKGWRKIGNFFSKPKNICIVACAVLSVCALGLTVASVGMAGVVGAGFASLYLPYITFGAAGLVGGAIVAGIGAACC